MADLDLGPRDADELIRRLRLIAAGNLRVVDTVRSDSRLGRAMVDATRGMK